MADLLLQYDLYQRHHLEWLHHLDYIQDQVKIFQNELMRVLHQHPDYMSIIEHVDEYRAILMRKLQHIDEFRSQIALQERLLKGEEGGIGLPAQPSVENLQEQIELFFQEFEDIKITLRRFVARND